MTKIQNLKLYFVFCIVILIFTFCILNLSGAAAEEINPSAVAERRAELEQELQKLEAQIEGYRGIIQEKQKQATTLERDIAILDAKIEKAKLEIKMRNLQIDKLSKGIGEKSVIISSLTEKIEKEKSSLAELLRKTQELDANSLMEIILGYQKMSDFFIEPDSFETIQAAIHDYLNEVRDTKQNTEKEKDELEDRKAEQMQLKSMQELEKKRLTEDETEKKKILKIAKGEEARYQKFLNDKQKDAAAIRSQLFLLTGSPAIPFEKAVKYAVLAWRQTGVRPAFLLGVIAEESNLGANVGTGNWKTDLSHSRCEKQRLALTEICAELGLDPDLMPVSKKAWYGYCGGAMGPAQFMPTTWQLYKSRISAITGNNPPNPWDPEDAFVAAALLLKDNGAANGGGYAAERKAALKYLAGSNWSKSSYAFYGDDVMELAAKYQGMIDIINK
ncbi:MAG: lytic murein transglycosylase [Candidatus Terrybacteria bacterium]|nr:lytic murein transglycosylase [Candidatus Terrybacteria bacterium]